MENKNFLDKSGLEHLINKLQSRFVSKDEMDITINEIDKLKNEINNLKSEIKKNS